ncbi:hypothetical protein QU889_17670 [Klebsiella variicola]|uniref:hypothetical protein n=1 Tax=Klebsiella variicola TaxID=244366 RepID=UPI0022309167|nr:hypothetical protein [Klebsiella variicola]MDM8777210.1 hypothetical protein [Klebsiella variicola]
MILDDEKIIRVENALMCLEIFSRDIHTFFAMANYLNILDEDPYIYSPFRNICNALLGDAAVRWCQVFGTDSEENHWKKTLSNHDEIRLGLLDCADVDINTYKKYNENMREFRNMAIAHFEPKYMNSENIVPTFNIALKTSSYLHRYLRDLLPMGMRNSHPEDLTRFGEITAQCVLNRLGDDFIYHPMNML